MSKVLVKGDYVVEDLPNPKGKIVGYRRIRPPDQPGHIINIALLEGGGSKATSVWHPKTERKSANPTVQAKLNDIYKQARHAANALRRARRKKK